MFFFLFWLFKGCRPVPPTPLSVFDTQKFEEVSINGFRAFSQMA